MSKSRGNIVDPWAVIERHGADAVRLFLVASSNVWVPRAFDERVLAEQAGRFLRTFKNVYSGIFAQYANFGWSPSEQDPPLAARPIIDRWMISRLATARARGGRARSRRTTRRRRRGRSSSSSTTTSRTGTCGSTAARFYDVDGDDNRAAFATLHEVLVSVCRLLAPFAPFVSDWMHRELTGESVHLAPYRARRGGAGRSGAGRARCRRSGRWPGSAVRRAKRRVSRCGSRCARMVCVAPNVPRRRRWSRCCRCLAAELNVKQVEFAQLGGRAGDARGEAELPRAG